MARRVILCVFAVVCISFLLNPNLARGQAVFGSVIGTVTDAQGAGVAGAKVTVTSVGKGTVYETTSNDSGNYAVTHLIPDDYRVHFEAAGFKAYDVASVSVSADSAASIDASMQVGATTQTIEVTSEIPQLQTDRADVAIQFSQKYIEDLPVLNRNFTSFELLSPGTQKLPGFNHAATENPQGGGQIQVNGQHFSGTNFELDGTDNQDPILGIIVVNPNLDAIAETKIALQDYDAESGKSTSGIIRVQTKSGSNEFHGSGFYYYRNSDQQARDPFSNKPGVPLAAATYKQFGGSVGGPIIKDKLFFFADYQGTKQIQGITNQYTVPTTQVDQTCNPMTNGASNDLGFCDLSQYLDAYGPVVGGVHSGQIYNPYTAGSTQAGAGRQMFVNNQIPIGMISQNIGNLLALLPAPNQAGAAVNAVNFVSTGSGPFDQKSFDTRIDYSAPHNYQVFGRFSLDYFSLSGKGGLGTLGGEGFGPGGLNGSSNVHNYSLATGFTKPIGARWLTDLRFGYFKYNPQTAYSDSGTNPMTALGFPGLNMGTSETGGLSGFFFTGNGSIGNMNPGTSPSFGDGLNTGRCNCPLTESEQQFQVVNNWTRTQGNHTIKFGADIRYAENLRVPSDQSRTGLLSFDAGDTSNLGSNGLALATLILGDVTSFQRYVSTSTNAAERQKRWFFYGQDSWRISPKFTMTYGLRWEIYFPETVNAKGNGGFADLTDGLIRVAGYGGVGSNGNVANTYKAFAPRLSFAYAFDPKTVVRIGYGRGFDIGVFGSNYGHVVTQNLPVLARQDLTDTNLNPAFTNNRSAIFSLNPVTAAAQGLNFGPQAFSFASILADITPQGTLPINGVDGSTQGGARPLFQRLPTIDQWNGTVQRQLTPTLNITVSYIGNKGTHVFAGGGPSYNNNEVAPGGGTNTVNIACTVAVSPCPAADQFPVLGGFTPFQSQTNRTRLFANGVAAFNYPTYVNGLGQTISPPPCCAGGTNYYGNDADNKYNALQVQADKRVSQGLQFLAHYTFSHAFAYDTNQFSTIDKKFAWGPNGDNRNQVFVINTIYELPVGKGKRFLGDAGRIEDLVVGGWQITNTTTYGTGLPWTPSIAECGEVTDVDICRPNISSQQKLATGVTHVGNNVYWFTPVAPLAYPLTLAEANAGVDACTLARPVSGPFALPACGQIGNVGINSYRGPHAFYDDAALSKTFVVTERVKAQFRFDAYNLFNHPVLALPNSCVDCKGSASAGQITDIEADSAPGAPIGMRQLQFAVRVTF
jgi:hypothetical protein